MSPSESTTTYPVVMLRHRRTLADTIRYDGTEHCRMAIHDWIVGNGGTAEVRHNGELWVLTRNRWACAKSGQWVLHATTGDGRPEFWPVDPDVVDFRYEPAGGPDHTAVMTPEQVLAMRTHADDIAREVATAPSDEMAMWIGEHVERLREMVHALGSTVEAVR